MYQEKRLIYPPRLVHLICYVNGKFVFLLFQLTIKYNIYIEIWPHPLGFCNLLGLSIVSSKTKNKLEKFLLVACGCYPETKETETMETKKTR